MSLSAKAVPPISKEFFAELEKNFGRDLSIAYRPGTTIEEVMFHAGQRQVVEWCRNQIRGQASSGNAQAIVKP